MHIISKHRRSAIIRNCRCEQGAFSSWIRQLNGISEEKTIVDTQWFFKIQKWNVFCNLTTIYTKNRSTCAVTSVFSFSLHFTIDYRLITQISFVFKHYYYLFIINFKILAHLFWQFSYKLKKGISTYLMHERVILNADDRRSITHPSDTVRWFFFTLI